MMAFKYNKYSPHISKRCSRQLPLNLPSGILPVWLSPDFCRLNSAKMDSSGSRTMISARSYSPGLGHPGSCVLMAITAALFLPSPGNCFFSDGSLYTAPV